MRGFLVLCILGAACCNKLLWKYSSTVNPSLHDAFVRNSTSLTLVFQSRADQCSRCRVDQTLRLDYHGVVKEPTWSCAWDADRTVNAHMVVDPHGHAFVLTCSIPPATPRITITAAVRDEPPLVYEDVPIQEVTEPPSMLAACTMVRRPHMERLVEWLAYHHIQGFERFLLYSDGDPTYLHASLRGYVDKRVVHVMDWEWPTYGFHNQQTQMYSCLHRTHAQWVAFFDMDEYFQPLNLTLTDLLHPSLAGIAVRMVLFTPRDAGLLTQSSQWRTDFAWPNTERSKCIAQVSKVWGVGVHVITGADGPILVADPLHQLRLNHYRAGFSEPTTIHDTSMTQYGVALRAEIQRYYTTWY